MNPWVPKQWQWNVGDSPPFSLFISSSGHPIPRGKGQDDPQKLWIESCLNKCTKCYLADQVEAGGHLLLHLLSILQRLLTLWENTEAHDQPVKEYHIELYTLLIHDLEYKSDTTHTYHVIHCLHSDFTELQRLEEALASDTGWSHSSNHNNIHTTYRADDTRTQTIRVQGVIQACAFNVMAVISELDLYSTWMPHFHGLGVKYCNEIHHVSRMRKYGQVITGFPWPFANREMNVYGFGSDALLETGRVLVAVKSVSPKDTPTEYPLPYCPKKHVLSTIHFGGFRFKPIGRHETELGLLFNLDFDLPHIPPQFINFFTKLIAPTVFTNIQAVAQSLSPEYQVRIDRDEYNLYSFIKTRLEAFYEQENAKVKDQEFQV